MTEESKNMSTPKTTTNGKGTKSTKHKKPKSTFTESDIPKLIEAIVAVPKRRKTYNGKQMLERLRPSIYEGVRAGRSVDDIFMTIAPMLHVSRATFDSVLDAKKLATIEGAFIAIETTATEIRSEDATPKSLAASDTQSTIDITAEVPAQQSPAPADDWQQASRT